MSYNRHLQDCLGSEVFAGSYPGRRVEIKTGFGWKPATVVRLKGGDLKELVVLVDGEETERSALPFACNFRELLQESLL